jgi:hypothetical protein
VVYCSYVFWVLVTLVWLLLRCIRCSKYDVLWEYWRWNNIKDEAGIHIEVLLWIVTTIIEHIPPRTESKTISLTTWRFLMWSDRRAAENRVGDQLILQDVLFWLRVGSK